MSGCVTVIVTHALQCIFLENENEGSTIVKFTLLIKVYTV